MKFLAALLLVVASVHSNSLHHYGWAPGQEMVYNYQSQVLTGIPEISQSHWSGIKMNAKVNVQARSDYSLHLRISEPEFFAINGENVRLSETQRVMRESNESVKPETLTEEFKRFLTEPFVAHLKAGMVESLLVSKNEPASITNIKKSVLSQLQMDITGSRQVESNHIQLPVGEEGAEQVSFFTTKEESVQGECLTEYTIHKLPQWKVYELESAWRAEESLVKDFKLSESKTVCEGKPYYMITKTKNLEQCTKSPYFQMYTRDTLVNNDYVSSEVGTTVSTTTSFVCGESLNEFIVRKTHNKRIAELEMLGYKADEMAVSQSQVNMFLLETKPITSRMSLPSTTRVVKSLVYGFPAVNGKVIGEEDVSLEVSQKSEELFGVKPLLPQPSLYKAPHNLLMNLNKEQIIPHVLEQIQKMAREVYQSPESCASKSDVAGKLSTLPMYMRGLDITELEQLESKVLSIARSTNMKSMEKIFYDILSLVGTNPSTMLIVKRVKEGSLPESRLTKIVSLAIRNIRYPTEELLEELVKMIKSSSVKANKQLYTTSLLQLSSLFYHAYISPVTMKNNFPTRIFGVFGTKESTVLTEKYIPHLIEEIERTESEHVGLTAILALGKTGHLKGLKTLVKIIETASLEASTPTKVNHIIARRTIAVNALKRVAIMNPTEIRPILLAIALNPVESAEVRIAAVSVLPFSIPTTAELQKLAIRSWTESSEQVRAFIVSTIRSLAYTKVPELKAVSAKARALLPLIKSEIYGIQYSHTLNISTFIEYLRTLIIRDFQLVNTKESLVPHKFSVKADYYSPSHVMKIPTEFTTYTFGMDFLLEKYLHFFSTEEITTPSIKQQLVKIAEELKLKTRELSTPFGFNYNLFAGIEHSTYLDSAIVMEALEKMTMKFESGLNMEFNEVEGFQVFDASYVFVTETGFPVMATSTMPHVLSLKGSLTMTPMAGNVLPKVSAKFVPVYNGKVQTHCGVISPLTKEFIGTGVEASLHSSLPVEIEGKVTKGQVELSLRMPKTGRQSETLHGFIRPYTYKYNVLQVTPLTHSTSIKTILSGPIVSVEKQVGKSLGVSALVQYKADARALPDLTTVIQGIYQTHFIPTSLKMSSLSLDVSPSQTKEIKLILSLSTKGMMHSLSKKMITEQNIPSQYNQVKTVLSKLEKAHVVEITGMLLGSSGSELKKINLVAAIGAESSGLGMGAVEIAPVMGETYSLRMEGKTTVTAKIMNRWNIEKMIEEPLMGRVEGDLFYGMSNKMEHLKVIAQLEKSEELKKEIRQSPEYKMCKSQQGHQEKLTSVCNVVRSQAVSLDQVDITLKTPQTGLLSFNSPLSTYVEAIARTLTIGNIVSEEKIQGTPDTLNVVARADRTSELITFAQIRTPFSKTVLKNMRFLGLISSGIFPTTMLSNPLEMTALKLTGHPFAQFQAVPSTCRVEPTLFTTFDNVTVDYKINDCEHVLLMDGSRHIPIAITTKTVEGQKKMVKILSGITEIQMIPANTLPLPMKVMMGSEELHPVVGEKLIKKNSEGRILAIVQLFKDNVISVYIPEQGLKVISNGSMIEIVAPQILKNSALGLCGDMNGEFTADLTTPRMCVMRPRLAALSFMLPSGSCSGIPAPLKKEFEHESKICARQTIVPTPVDKLYERISVLNHPTGMTHVVEKQSGKLYISKQMVKTCLSKPISIKQRSVEFVSIPWPSVQARSLERRALSGMALHQELSSLPTVFRKVEFEPVACRSEASSISL